MKKCSSEMHQFELTDPVHHQVLPFINLEYTLRINRILRNSSLSNQVSNKNCVNPDNVLKSTMG